MCRTLKQLIFLFLLLYSFISSSHPHEEDKPKFVRPKVEFLPYVPEKKEYGLELGSMWENKNLYWLSGSFGYHLGQCVLFTDQTCQQYVDFIGGVGGSQDLTTGLALASLRWQFVSYPRPFSPMIRIFYGAMNIRDNDRDFISNAYGVGYGFTTSVHENLDFRIEARVGGAHSFFSQVFLSFALKIDRWVDYFAVKIRKAGKNTVSTTGTVLEKTVIDAPIEAARWLKIIDKKSSKKAKEDSLEKPKKPTSKKPAKE